MAEAFDLDWKSTEFLVEMSRHHERGLRKGMAFLERETKRAVSRGQRTRRSGSGRVGLDPSLPGEPPKVVTGRLRQSIRGEVRRTGPVSIEGVLAAGTEYARRLELGFSGTDSAGRRVNQAPRPYMRPTVFNNEARVKEFIRRG